MKCLTHQVIFLLYSELSRGSAISLVLKGQVLTKAKRADVTCLADRSLTTSSAPFPPLISSCQAATLLFLACTKLVLASETPAAASAWTAVSSDLSRASSLSSFCSLSKSHLIRGPFPDHPAPALASHTPFCALFPYIDLSPFNLYLRGYGLAPH